MYLLMLIEHAAFSLLQAASTDWLTEVVISHVISGHNKSCNIDVDMDHSNGHRQKKNKDIESGHKVKFLAQIYHPISNFLIIFLHLIFLV